jgi:excisionase family DNA binding protein
MKSRRASARRVKIHHNYTPEHAAEIIGAHKNTVLRWITSGALPAVTDGRPYLILGRDLKPFLARKSAASRTLRPGQCYCVKCKDAQSPALNMAEYVPIKSSWGNLRGICPECETLMHRRVALARIAEVKGTLDLTFVQPSPHLERPSDPSTNVDKGNHRHDGKKPLPGQ